ncbi:MAG: phosphopyruvate hydratase [Polyangiaceae bacterium]
MRIKQVRAREILDSRGFPTVEADVVLDNGISGRAAIPSGASTGSREAVELRDRDKARFEGKGVLKAVEHLRNDIGRFLFQKDASDQAAIDEGLRNLDGTEQKARLGANAILAASLAVARASAAARGLPLYRALAEDGAPLLLPVPMFNVLNGGVHADNSVDFQEFMVVPVSAPDFRGALRMGAEVYQALKATLKQAGHSTSVGDEGGFAPNLRANVEAIEMILRAIERAGYHAGKDVVLALDPAASEFYVDGTYVLGKSGGRPYTPEQLVELWQDWVRQFPIASIEDGLAEDDWRGWRLLTAQLGDQIQLVGDDIFVTQAAMLRKGIAEHVANAVLVKLNQVGTLTETLETMTVAREAGYSCVVSHRSGETTDDFIADFTVATGAGQIKTGAPCRGERVAKYNQLARIEEDLGSEARYAGGTTFAATLRSRPTTGGSPTR